jgi:hypothetical protein
VGRTKWENLRLSQSLKQVEAEVSSKYLMLMLKQRSGERYFDLLLFFFTFLYFCFYSSFCISTAVASSLVLFLFLCRWRSHFLTHVMVVQGYVFILKAALNVNVKFITTSSLHSNSNIVDFYLTPYTDLTKKYYFLLFQQNH